MFFWKKQTYILTPIQELLLALLRAQLWLKPVDDVKLPTTIDDWNALMDLAYKQTVVCFISAACLRHKNVNLIPHDIREEMHDVIEENKKIYRKHNEVLLELVTYFELNGLHPVLLKGQGISLMYFEPELRQCGDIDLYFLPCEYECAKKCLGDILNEKKNKESYKHSNFIYKGIIVELHRRTAWIPNPFVNKRFQQFSVEKMNETFVIIILGKKIHIPDPIYNILYVFIHMWNHFEDRGISLRQMCDVLMMMHYYKGKIPLEKIFFMFKSFSLVWPLNVVDCLFSRYFDFNYLNNVCFSTRDKYRANIMLGIILMDGAFNYDKHRCQYENMSFWRRRLAVHWDRHKEFMKIYPVSGMRIFWRYAAFKQVLLYRFAKWWCEQ